MLSMKVGNLQTFACCACHHKTIVNPVFSKSSKGFNSILKIKTEKLYQNVAKSCVVHKKPTLQFCLKHANFWTSVEGVGQKAHQIIRVYTLINVSLK